MRIALDSRAALVIGVLAAAMVGCQASSATPLASSPPATAVGTTAPPPSASLAAVDPSTLDGVWEGAVNADGDAYPVTMRFVDCADGVTCGDAEYADPAGGFVVMCAAEVTLDGTRDGALVAQERMTFNPWQCFPSTMLLRPAANGSMLVEQYGDLEEPPFASGTLQRTSADGKPSPPPVPAAIPGLGTPTAAIDLGGTTTQYTADGHGSLWLPLDQGAVVRLDAATGAEQARIAIGDPAAVELHTDPHAVAVAEDGAWVSSAAAHALVQIDPATNAIGRQIDLDVEPYAVAIEGRTAWVTSFASDALLKVDLDSGETLATTEVLKPTGVAVGAGGIWVVEHRINTVAHVDPVSAEVLARVEIGPERPNDVCGACVENVIVADGAVWTSDNHLRSVTRIDPGTDAVAARIELPMRVWAVTAGGGRIWASQMDDDFSAMDDWTTFSIDPATNEPTTHALACVLRVVGR